MTRYPALVADLIAGAATAVGVVLLAAPTGLVWAALSPRVLDVMTSAGAVPVDPETKGFAAADGYFVVVSLVVGVLCGLFAYVLARRWAPGVVVGLGTGGVLAALIAARIGKRLYWASFVSFARHARIGSTALDYVRVQMDAAYVVWALLAVTTFAVLLLFDRRTFASPYREPTRQWGSMLPEGAYRPPTA
jgi:hypothetical protein